MTGPSLERIAARNRVVAVRAAVLRLAGVLRSARVYSTDNRALSDGIESACSRLAPLVADLGEILLRIEGTLVRVNGTMIAQLGRGAVQELASFGDDLAARGLGGIHFQSPPCNDDLRHLVALWAKHDDLPPRWGLASSTTSSTTGGSQRSWCCPRRRRSTTGRISAPTPSRPRTGCAPTALSWWCPSCSRIPPRPT